MSTEALKNEIIDWISRSNDNSLLKTLKSVKDSHASPEDWYEGLTRNERESILRGLQDHKNSEVLSSAEFWSDYES